MFEYLYDDEESVNYTQTLYREANDGKNMAYDMSWSV